MTILNTIRPVLGHSIPGSPVRRLSPKALGSVLATLLVVLCVCLGLAVPAKAAEGSLSREEFSKMLREALREDPSLVLDVLRENSEAILDIAQKGSDQRFFKKLQAQWQLDMQNPKTVQLENRPMRGKADAPVTIVAFSDFSCPYCRQAEATLAVLMQRHEHKVRFVFKHFPLDGRKNSRLAAQYHIAATLQDEAKAWKFYDLLFAGAPRIAEEGETFLRAAAEEAGLDTKLLAQELKKGTRISAILDEDMADAKKLGFDGTPNFLVNDLVVKGALPLEFFSEAINMAHEAARSKSKP